MNKKFTIGLPGGDIVRVDRLSEVAAVIYRVESLGLDLDYITMDGVPMTVGAVEKIKDAYIR